MTGTILRTPKVETPGQRLPNDGHTGAIPEIQVGLLTGGFDRPYAYGLTMALAAKRIALEIIGSAELDGPEMHNNPRVHFVNLYWDSRKRANVVGKILRVLSFYQRLFRYTATARPKILHILWNNKFELFDRTLLMLFYKLLGKKVVLTAHNVNAGKRDGTDSWLNRFSLKLQYQLVDHIFVHTEKMKCALSNDFQISTGKVSVIPFGINNSVPQTDLSSAEAKRILGIGKDNKTVLFFGAIRPYKGLEHLVAAFQQVALKDKNYRLIIVGQVHRKAGEYMRDIQDMIQSHPSRGQIILKPEFIPDNETEIYFKAADVSALPYTTVFQSGVLFLSFSFGLPAIATDVGSFDEEIIRGKTGFLCKASDSVDLARAIEEYFASELFMQLEGRRREIIHNANEHHSWDKVGTMTRKVYQEMLQDHDRRSDRSREMVQ